MEILGYNRIIIVGNNGSGKSFLSRELSAITGLPVVHLDAHFWKPNWVKTPEDEWIRKQAEFISEDKWIIDGNHCSTMEPRFHAADMVIFLDINRFVCLFSLLKRNGVKRLDSPRYLEEKIDRQFLRFCGRMWNFSKTGKITILELHRKYPDKPFLVIRSRSGLKQILTQWRNEKIERNCE